MMKRLLGFVMMVVGLVCIGSIIKAEEIKIEKCYEATGDLSASMVQNQRKDMNGNVCALVKVALPLNGAVFEGNVVGDVEFKAGEYWVYMTPGTKMLQIKHETATPTMIDFPDYGIPALESKTTYALVLTPPNIGYNKGDGANGSYLLLDITPKTGVVVEVDGKFLPVENGQATTFLEYGNHEFTVRANGYEPYIGTAKIEKGKKTTIPVNLVSNMASLTIKPETSGASIKINGKESGTGTFTESIVPGTYLVEVEKPGHHPWTETVVIAERENKTLTVPALQPIYGSLNVDYKPVGASISIDGKEVGTTPEMIGDLLIGTHAVTISKEGYDTFTTNISITEAETANITGSLTEAPKISMEELRKKYWFASDFSEGFMAVKYKDKDKWGFIDTFGREVIPFKYDFAWNFHDGMAIVELNGKKGFIDKTGKEVVPFKYEFAQPFSEGLALVTLNDKSGFVDKSGKEVIPLKYDGAASFSEGLGEVSLNNKIGFINKNGEVVVPIKYDGGYTQFSDGLAALYIGDKWGFVDKMGKEAVPFIYDNAVYFTEGRAIVLRNGKYGYIDTAGTEIIPLKYDSADTFHEGIARVGINNKFGFIDKSGKEITPLNYDGIGAFSEGRGGLELNGKWGYIDNTGKIVISFRFDDAETFENGKARVKLNGREFYIDKSGNEVR